MPRMIRYQPTDARRVLIIANPSAGSGANRTRIQALRTGLETAGCKVEITSNVEQLAATAGSQSPADLRAVVAAGGDGTVAEVINRTSAQTPIAVLPLGTENLLAKYVDAIVTPRELCHRILHGATIRVDAGQAAERVFLLMTGCGFDADVVRRLHQTRSGHIHHHSYVKPILSAMRNYQYPALRVECETGEVAEKEADGRPSKGQICFTARWLFVVNIPRYAGGLRFAPQANGADGLLDVCGFTNGSLLSGLRYLSGVVRGSHTTWPDCYYMQATRVRVTAESEVPYQLDGDPGGTLPLEISVLPERVNLIVTEHWAVQRGYRHELK